MSQKLKREEIERKLIVLRVDKKKLSKLNLNCAYGYTDSIIKLIESGININDEDKSANTPLMISCMLGYTRLPEMLIKFGADVNKPNINGVTALHMAACYGHVKTVQLLLYHGANESAESNDYTTPFDYTAGKFSTDHLKIKELLVFYAEKRSFEAIMLINGA